MNNIIEDLSNFALENNIGVELSYLFSPITPAGCNTSYRKIAINMNWHNKRQIPFTFAHEISHILNGDVSNKQLYFSTAVSHSKIESAANRKAISILLPYYLEEMPNEMINSADFMQTFDIPDHLIGMVESELTKIISGAS